ncbi:hypothetical protein BU26DRAFT_348421 [Trematosphaeria pertusa]|uniref:Uncharacterized protein n=1 Tax=Trematosphaeria pertusa TaxID=390896 RepID=A0A6A6IB53_9PLEO|nr:uncharacterized protein BU26DRAFT_348421 [Trematosphaeria pertusa]KAF2247469.1 hypothetical protein BU26DRAFT_348421 [Trematosphaeria pertusa]
MRDKKYWTGYWNCWVRGRQDLRRCCWRLRIRVRFWVVVPGIEGCWLLVLLGSATRHEELQSVITPQGIGIGRGRTRIRSTSRIPMASGGLRKEEVNVPDALALGPDEARRASLPYIQTFVRTFQTASAWQCAEVAAWCHAIRKITTPRSIHSSGRWPRDGVLPSSHGFDG